MREWNRTIGKWNPFQNVLTGLFNEGQKRIDKSLDVVGLIRDIKYLKMITMFKLNPDIET